MSLIIASGVVYIANKKEPAPSSDGGRTLMNHPFMTSTKIEAFDPFPCPHEIKSSLAPVEVHVPWT